MPALAAAVTPIMKLLVVVDTLNGSFIASSIASTFTAPDPMPSSPDSVPAPNMIPNASWHVLARTFSSLPSPTG